MGYPRRVPGLDRSDAARAKFLAALPRRYSPWLHLAVPNIHGAVVIAACVSALDGPGPAQWLTPPLVFVMAQAIEWRFHRDLLHYRVAPLQFLYDAHTVSHHAIFVPGAMELHAPRELRAVLFPWWAFTMLTVMLMPPALALAWLFGRDVGLLFMISTHAYFIVYEFLHTIYHLPARSVILRLWPFRQLAAHHTLHHDPRWMQRVNFGVSTPLWDVVRGTRRS